jgi:hypothetical protein
MSARVFACVFCECVVWLNGCRCFTFFFVSPSLPPLLFFFSFWLANIYLCNLIYFVMFRITLGQRLGLADGRGHRVLGGRLCHGSSGSGD